MRSSLLLALAASISSTLSLYQGFNYGSTQTDGSVKAEIDFENEFKTAQNLVGTSGFTSARLYTMIQGGTANSPTSAIQAAINTKTTLLLGIWASAGQGQITSEIAALQAAISQYGTAFTSLVAGLSVGSEDLYRISPTGLTSPGAAPGADPSTLINYISQVRTAVAGTTLSGVQIGHVDTWTAWVNGSNSAVISACDFIGMDAYPYFQNTMPNGIENNAQLFQSAYGATVAVAQGKDVWVTETGFPVSGSTSGAAVPGLANAKTYWDEVGCGMLFGKVNTYWFTLQDAYPTTPNPSFGLVGTTLSTSPLFDLTCPAATASSNTDPSSTSSPQGADASSPSASPTASASVVTSASTAATTASQSGGLTPSEGAGNGVVSSVKSATTTAPVASSVATISSNSNNNTMVTSVVSGNGSVSTSSPTSTGRATASNNGAAATAGPMFGAIGAMMAVMAAL